MKPGRLPDGSSMKSARPISFASGRAPSAPSPSLRGAWQQGNALQIYPGTNTNTFVRYFWDSSSQSLRRTTKDPSDLITVAHSVSNAIVFTAEDYLGKVLTNNFNNRVIGIKLQFYELQYPRRALGPGNLYEFYQVNTKVTRRKISL